MYKYKVFLVDDEPMVRAGLKKVLEKVGSNWQYIGEATNGKQALSMIRQLQPDLVISDIRMPGITGLQLLEAIKQLYPDTILILLTGYPEFEYAQHALRYGAFDYILKPSSAEDLMKVLNKAELEISKIKEKKSSKDPSAIPIELEFSLLNAIKTGNKADAFSGLTKIFDYLDFMTYQELVDYTNSLLMKMKNSLPFEFEPISLSFQTPVDVKEWLKEQITLCFNMVHVKETRDISFIIQRAMAVIRKKYNCDLTLKSVAVELCMNSSYLSVLFKQETGETFSNYLTNYRYNKAKELLNNPQLKIYEIGEQVGYVNGRHFSQMFKGKSGMTPKQYRNQLKIE
ncbi:response regulator transcription factor [Bacillus sp. SD088]|uniref:response regulator transcription factor n=1 Tax=Bacillus sp. SD088 TaxID=2782012 RepID=UPI001A95E2E1|nr:response regulator [Bacillus sp. SD088]MBO0993126.1 response regulator [Bacillus sp. SD088]